MRKYFTDQPLTVAEAYTQVAEIYDSTFVQAKDQAEDKWLKGYLVEQGYLGQGFPYPFTSILDMGCGTGYFLDQFCDWPPEFYLGLDISEGMLAKARVKHPGYQFVQHDISKQFDGDLENDLYASGHFEVALCLFSAVSYCRNLNGVFALLDQALKEEDGRFLIMAATPRYNRPGYILNQANMQVPFYTWSGDEWESYASTHGFTVTFRGFGYFQDYLPRNAPQPIFDTLLAVEGWALSKMLPLKGIQLLVEGTRL